MDDGSSTAVDLLWIFGPFVLINLIYYVVMMQRYEEGWTWRPVIQVLVFLACVYGLYRVFAA